MDLDKLNKWLTLAANIGVVAGIIFLGIEMQQNTDALKAGSRETVLFASQNGIYQLMEHPDLVIKVGNEEELSSEEQVWLGSFLAAAMRVREFSWLQYREGIIDETQWETEIVTIRFLLGAKLTRDYWEKVGRFNVSSSFASFVDSDLKNHPVESDSWLRETNWTD